MNITKPVRDAIGRVAFAHNVLVCVIPPINEGKFVAGNTSMLWTSANLLLKQPSSDALDQMREVTRDTIIESCRLLSCVIERDEIIDGCPELSAFIAELTQLLDHLENITPDSRGSV